MTLEKYNNTEVIDVGDIVSLKDNKAILSKSNFRHSDKNMIGVCSHLLDNNTIEVQTNGICDINVVGTAAIGDEITSSEISGKGRSIKYIQEKRMFDIRGIGKVIYLYKDLSKAKILLNIE